MEHHWDENGFLASSADAVAKALLDQHQCIRGQIFILDIAGWITASTRLLLKQTERKVKDKDLTPILYNLFDLVCRITNGYL